MLLCNFFENLLTRLTIIIIFQHKQNKTCKTVASLFKWYSADSEYVNLIHIKQKARKFPIHSTDQNCKNLCQMKKTSERSISYVIFISVKRDIVTTGAEHDWEKTGLKILRRERKTTFHAAVHLPLLSCIIHKIWITKAIRTMFTQPGLPAKNFLHNYCESKGCTKPYNIPWQMPRPNLISVCFTANIL